MAKTKGYALPAMSEEQIIMAVNAKKKGVFRKVTWITDEMTIGSKRDTITITKTMFVRIGIQYNHMKTVIDRKEAEDAAIGAPKERRESSYARMKNEAGEFVEPLFIVRDRTTMTKKFLQVCVSNAMDIRTKKPRGVEETFYKNGIEINPAENELLMKIIKATRTVKTKSDGPIETWVLPFDKILNIQ